MSKFRCLICGEQFGTKSSHYCEEHEFKLVTPESNADIWVELIDWEYELITNNKKK